MTTPPEEQVTSLGNALIFCVSCLSHPENLPNQASTVVGGLAVCISHFNEAQNAEESHLVTHAREDLELLGEDEETIAWYQSVIDAFVSFGHSGTSAEVTIPIITALLRGENLTPITDSPEEWYHHKADDYGVSQEMWQNKRNSALFSDDGGKTYWSVNEGAHEGHREPRHVSEPSGKV